jgi:hypothetical protein
MSNTENDVPFTSLEYILHLHGIQEAVSSILSTSTKDYKALRVAPGSLFLWPSGFVPVLCQFFRYGEVRKKGKK